MRRGSGRQGRSERSGAPRCRVGRERDKRASLPYSATDNAGLEEADRGDQRRLAQGRRRSDEAGPGLGGQGPGRFEEEGDIRGSPRGGRQEAYRRTGEGGSHEGMTGGDVLYYSEAPDLA